MRWDTDAIAATLGATSAPRLDPASGQGVELELTPRVRLGLYPDAGHIRLTADGMELSLHRLDGPPRLGAGELVIERPGLFLSVGAAGALTLLRSADGEGPPAPPGRPGAARAGAEGSSGADEGATPLAAHPGELSGDMAQPLPQPAVPVEGDKQQRLVLAGRVGADPTFRTTGTGSLIAKFPLAVKQVDDTTVWWRCVMFGERARALMDGQLAKGERVEVIGYVHSRQVQGRDGATKMVEELYAAAVRKPGTGT